MAIFLLGPHTVESREKGGKLPPAYSYKGTNPIMMPHFHDLITFKDPHLQLPSHMSFGVTHLVHSIYLLLF